MSKDYITIPQVARLCDVNRSTMWRWVKAGHVKTYSTLGGQHRIRKVDLEKVLSANRVYQVLGAKTALDSKTLKMPATRKGKILIVDDAPEMLKMTEKLLKSRGYETATASDGFEAGIRVMEFKPHLMVLDLVMPRMDGFEVCKRIKENPATSHIRVLAVSGYDTQENRGKILKAGADGFMAKPVDNAVFLDEVKRLC